MIIIKIISTVSPLYSPPSRLDLDPVPCAKAEPSHCCLDALDEPEAEATRTQHARAKVSEVVAECPGGSSPIQVEHIRVAVF